MMLRFLTCVMTFMVLTSTSHYGMADAPSLAALISSAQQGDASAEYELGQRYRGGREVPQSYVDAVEWYRKAAVQGYAPAEARLGGMYLAGYGGLPKDEKQARVWLNKAAEQGDSSAKLELTLYDNTFMRWERTFPPALRNAAFLATLVLALLLIVSLIIAVVRLIIRFTKRTV